MLDNRSFYITSEQHPKYKTGEIVVDDPMRVIVNKIEMVLFTNKGDFAGDVDFGANLSFYLWQTRVSVEYLRKIIQEQFDKYIPEMRTFNTTLNLELSEGSYQDILFIDITLNEVEVKAIFR